MQVRTWPPLSVTWLAELKKENISCAGAPSARTTLSSVKDLHVTSAIEAVLHETDVKTELQRYLPAMWRHKANRCGMKPSQARGANVRKEEEAISWKKRLGTAIVK